MGDSSSPAVASNSSSSNGSINGGDTKVIHSSSSNNHKHPSDVAANSSLSLPLPSAKPVSTGYHHLLLRPRVWNPRIVLLFAVMGVSFLLVYNSANHLFGFSYLTLSNSMISGNNLDKVLEKASMEDKTVILTTLNDVWAEPGSIFDVFLKSFEIGNGTRKLLDHLVIIALDKKAYVRCLQLHLHCYALQTKGTDFSREAEFMSSEYLEMMWRRIDFLRVVLEKGYSFVFTDTDIVWLRDPFPRFYPNADFQIACDRFNGNPSDVNNYPNGGFTHVKSNNRTVQFYKYWYDSRKNYPGNHDQDVLNEIKHDAFITEIGLQIKFLDTAYFGGFCQPSRDLNLVCTMHANCCVGLDNKINDLTTLLDDWRKYLALPANSTQAPSWSVPRDCRGSFSRPHSHHKPHGKPGSH